ncbi:MAG: hypothetical protein KDE19_04090 [Caldilineaceae bacterium]|nr:hypothetical protein [Caldilineaceae bacterium]
MQTCNVSLLHKVKPWLLPALGILFLSLFSGHSIAKADQWQKGQHAFYRTGSLLIPALTPTATFTPTPTPTSAWPVPCAAVGAADAASPLCTTTPSPTPTSAEKPDLTITAMNWRFLPTGCSSVPQMAPPVLDITVANIGTAAAGPFHLLLNNTSVPVDSGLAAGATTTIPFANGFNPQGDNMATVDSSHQVDELDESNNESTLTLFLPIPTVIPTCTPTSGTPTATATPSPTVTPTNTPVKVFSVHIGVEVPKTTVQVSETITALVTIENQSIGCQYPVLELTLFQLGDPIFRFDSPADVHPSVAAQTVYTLTATSPGTTTLQARAYGERYCDDFWQWTYVSGFSEVITSVVPPAPGDGNGDGAVDAGDLSACILELFDGDGAAVADVAGGTYAGTTGCDANQDNIIDAGDLSCTVLLIFAGADACGRPLSAVDTPLAHLRVGEAVSGQNGEHVVPITLSSNGHAVAAAAFSLQVGDAFDPTDGDGDGLPDMVHFPELTEDALFTATWQAGRLDVAMTQLTPPFTPLPDGALLAITVLSQNTTVAFDPVAPPSLGSTTGASVPLYVETSRVFLPTVLR